MNSDDISLPLFEKSIWVVVVVRQLCSRKSEVKD